MKISCLLLASLFCAAGALRGGDELSERLQPALDAITPDALLAHIKILASDEFEGRAPGSQGEDLSVKYITEQFKKIGLKPGNPDGTYVQDVPLAGIKSEPQMAFVVGDKTKDLKYPEDFVASSARLQPEVKIEKSDLVFVGYGVVAPEYGWDDYKNVDVKGKTLLMLIGDPPIPNPKAPSKVDDKMFKGKAMTYYGRWTYKYEIAAQKGAAANVVHPGHFHQPRIDRTDAVIRVDVDRKEHAQSDQKQFRLLVDAEPQNHQWNQRQVWDRADHLDRSVEKPVGHRRQPRQQPGGQSQRSSDQQPTQRPCGADPQMFQQLAVGTGSQRRAGREWSGGRSRRSGDG